MIFCSFPVDNKSHEKIKTSSVLVRLSTPSLLCLWLSARGSLVPTKNANLPNKEKEREIYVFIFKSGSLIFPLTAAHCSFLSDQQEEIEHLLGTIFGGRLTHVGAVVCVCVCVTESN